MPEDERDVVKFKPFSSFLILVYPIAFTLAFSLLILFIFKNLPFFIASIFIGVLVTILVRKLTPRVSEIGPYGIKIENSSNNKVIQWKEIESVTLPMLENFFYYALKTRSAGTIFLPSRTFFRDEGIEKLFVKYGNFEEIASALPLSGLTRWKKRGMDYISPTLSDKMATPFFPSNAKIGRFYKFLLIINAVIVVTAILYFILRGSH